MIHVGNQSLFNERLRFVAIPFFQLQNCFAVLFGCRLCVTLKFGGDGFVVLSFLIAQD